MSFNSSGQVSYLVLDSLAEGSKYGLEIIEYITQKTGGNFIMKKPTLYSCLTRMEKKGLVSSSFWGESEFGGKRHYYTITNQGKRTLEDLSKEFAEIDFSSNSNDEENVSPATKQENTSVADNQTFSSNESNVFENTSQNEQKPVFLQQNNIFDLVKEKPETQPNQQPTDTDENEDIVENQIDIFSFVNENNQTTSSNEQTILNEENVSSLEEQNASRFSIENENTNNNLEQLSNETNQEARYEESQEKVNQEKMLYYQNILEQNTTPAENNSQTEQNKKDTADDAKFLDENEKVELSAFEQEQNRRIYDTSSELKKYRKKKSFAENQIEMSVVYEKAEDAEIQRERIEQLKKSMLNVRQNNFESINEEQNLQNTPNHSSLNKNVDNDFGNLSYNQEKISSSNDTNQQEKIKDDAVFITQPRINENDIPIQKKITPPNIEVNIHDDNLPAPKRDSNLEPTYKDMMAKLFERKKEKSQQNILQANSPEIETYQNTENFVDYANLKKYYKSHGIEFNEYKKSQVERRHNTNFLKFISSAILFLLSGVGCAALYGIISACGLLQANTNFMFYTLPILFFVYMIFNFVRHKVYPSKKAVLIYNSLINWAVFVLACVIVFVVNVTCGMQYETITQYITSWLVPIYGLLIAFPINYYIKKFLYKKFSK